MSALPKRLGHIWIGPKPAPVKWMETWPQMHPDWEYTVYDNDFLASYPFRLRPLINEYFWRGLYAGVQDMMRYEILYEFGGFMADADAICLHRIDELLDKPRAYTVYDRPETDKFRGVCPFLASEPGNPFLGQVIDELAVQDPGTLRKAEVSTGNRFLMRMIREIAPSEEHLKIFPTHYFVPWQKSDPENIYDGPDTVYAEQKWATSTYAYNRADGPGETVLGREELEQNRNQMLDRLVGGKGRRLAPLREHDAGLVGRVDKLDSQVKTTFQSPACEADFEDLNSCLIAAVQAGGVTDQSIHGLHFYRHMQQTPLVGSKFRTRSASIRARLSGWLAQAQDALLIGFDSGHLPLTALHMNDDLRVTAIESAKWRRDKDRNPPATNFYVPAAADWLAGRFGPRFRSHIGTEIACLQQLAEDPKNKGRFDLLMLPASDVMSLSIVTACRDLLSPDAIIVCASAEHDTGAAQGDRLMMQGLAYTPFERQSYGAHNGSMCAFRPILTP